MTYADKILEVLDDEYLSGPDIAKRIGVAPCRISTKMRMLEKYGLVERGEEVRTSNGHMTLTWRRRAQ